MDENGELQPALHPLMLSHLSKPREGSSGLTAFMIRLAHCVVRYPNRKPSKKLMLVRKEQKRLIVAEQLWLHIMQLLITTVMAASERSKLKTRPFSSRNV